MSTMQIEALWTYPIKALRAHSLTSAELTRNGFKYDRRFMLLEEKKDDSGKTTFRNMQVAHDPAGTLFFPTLHEPSDYNAGDGKIVVSFRPPKDSGKQEANIEIPLEPDVKDLGEIEVTMHGSPTKAYRMPDEINSWFQTHFGYSNPVILAYLGSHYRPVLMSSSHAGRDATTATTAGSSWLSSIANTATTLLAPITGATAGKQITFADCAPYLVCSSASLPSLHARLPEGQQMDISKFRPNIIISGAKEAWEEDYWAELSITSSKSAEATVIDCIHNCGRCKSINIDYATGKPGTGEEGKILAKMQKDRRVDPGMKYSPIFGRYSFLRAESEGHVVSVGDRVEVSRRNEEGTRFGKSFLPYQDGISSKHTVLTPACRLARHSHNIVVPRHPRNVNPKASHSLQRRRCCSGVRFHRSCKSFSKAHALLNSFTSA